MQFRCKALILTAEQLELSIGEMERRFEARIEKKIESMTKRFVDFTAKDSKVEVCPVQGECLRAKFSANELLKNHVSVLEQKLESIEKAVGITARASAGDDDEDRKRLKERLKEALATEQQKRQACSIEKETWLEYTFGICKRNGREGKRGSR